MRRRKLTATHTEPASRGTSRNLVGSRPRPITTVIFNVWWEDDPTKSRDVTDWCRICFPSPGNPNDIYLVSPSGIAHEAETDTTVCGHNATGPEWWWRT